jgi:hypothetical protein
MTTSLKRDVVSEPRTPRTYGLGRGAAHRIDERSTEGLPYGSLTVCGLAVGEALRPETVVQRPGLKWPLPHCKKCWRHA